MLKRAFPAGFIVPSQPIEASRPPAGPDWVHEIKHDGYRLIVRREGATVRLWTRKAVDYTDRMRTIAIAASRLPVDSFTIDGEVVVVRPHGLSQFDELRRRTGAQSAILFAFDLLEHDGEDFRPHAAEQNRSDVAEARAVWRKNQLSLNPGE